METKFWMVLKAGTNYTCFRHPTYGEAIAEATRLANVDASSKFYVLEAVGSAQKPPVSLYTEFKDC